jgi:hypothetical protein
MPCWSDACLQRLLLRSAVAAIVSASLATSEVTADIGAETPNPTLIGPTLVARVTAVLVLARPMSTAAATVMQAEAARIWGRYSVGIVWRAPGPAIDPSVTLVVVVSGETARCAPYRADRQDTLGCFPQVPMGNALPVIKVFPDRVRRLVDREVVRLCRRCSESAIERLMATLLGRTLAHEIGHFLLGPEHTATGLMKANIGPAELFTREAEVLSLTDAQVASLAKATQEGR